MPLTAATVLPRRASLADVARQELADLHAFLRRPTRSRRLARDQTHLLLRPALLLLLATVFILAVSVPLDYVMTQVTTIREGDIDSKPWFVYAALGFAPLWEELVFRAGLRSARYTLGLGLPLVTAILGTLWLGAAMLALVLLAALWLRTQARPGQRFRLGRVYLQRYPLVFWLWTGAFAYAHIANFVSDDWTGLFTVALVTPQLAAGVILGYARLRQGLGTAILMHAAYNGLALALTSLVG